MIVNKHRMAAWVERLESGEIVQGHDRLHYVNGQMCCLGVVTELAREDDVPVDRQVCNAEGGELYYIYDSVTSGFLPRVVQGWLGIDDNDPDLNFGDKTFSATRANDREGYEFPVIAAAIRRTYIDTDAPCCDGVACPDKVSTAK